MRRNDIFYFITSLLSYGPFKFLILVFSIIFYKIIIETFLWYRWKKIELKKSIIFIVMQPLLFFILTPFGMYFGSVLIDFINYLSLAINKFTQSILQVVFTFVITNIIVGLLVKIIGFRKDSSLSYKNILIMNSLSLLPFLITLIILTQLFT